MGIFINLAISKSVTKEEWKKVYEETLQLIKCLPFAEKRRRKIHDIDMLCLVPTEEKEKSYGLKEAGKTYIGWNTVGDYEDMRTAENYYLPRDLIRDNKIEADAQDAILGALPAYMDYEWNDERCNHVYELWGAKTQGEPYHIYLLAVAALIEARLGTKAFTYGDITRGQFKRAVEIANQHLENKIDIPDRCYMDRLLKRVSALPLPMNEQLAVFEQFYLGTQDAEFGEYMRQTFPEDVIEVYWEEKFRRYEVGTIGFDKFFAQYMLWGFELENLCGYVNFTDEEGNTKYEKFVKVVMDAKFHIKEKNCSDALEIDQEEQRPYSVATLFAQFVFAGARNKKVDRYIPIEQIKKALTVGIGNQCNVEELIDSYLAEEEKENKIDIIDKEASDEKISKAVKQDASNVFNQIMEKKRQELEEKYEKYDIADYDDLKFYKKGNTIHPEIIKTLGRAKNFVDSKVQETEFKELMNQNAYNRCEWLVERDDRYFLIRDKDWEKIFTDIEENKESFLRYYALHRIKVDSREIADMCIALIINDELYAYSRGLTEQTDD